MSRIFVREVPIFLLLVVSGLALQNFSDNYILSDGSVFRMNLTELHDITPYIQEISIRGNSSITFNVTNVSSSASFIIFQIHIYQHNVTLSYDKDHLNKVSNRSVFGSNIGLLKKLDNNVVTQMFVKNNNVHDVKALVVSIAYNHRAPVPGGCNMEFNTEIAPYARVQTSDTMVIVDVQPASVPFNNTKPNCEKNPVEYNMYRMFLREQDFSSNGYFKAISSMLMVKDIQENGDKIAISTTSSPMRRIFNAYTGVGSVYVMVATYGDGSAAYVPTFSYGCHPAVNPESCNILTTSFAKSINVCCFVVGLISVLLGHRLYGADRILPIFITISVISYIALGDIGIAILLGLCLAVAWMIVQYCFSFVAWFSIVPTGLFFACVAYFHSPDSFIILHNNWVFWSLFVTLAVVLSAITVLCSFCCPITTVIFSTFMVVVSIDYWVGSALKYIIINIVRRATVENFGLASVQPPVQAADITLIMLWTCLALYRVWKHFTNLSVGTISELTPLLS